MLLECPSFNVAALILIQGEWPMNDCDQSVCGGKLVMALQ